MIVAENNNTPAKRVSIVSIKMVKEGSILYAGRKITTSSQAAEIARQFLEDCDREKLIVCCLDTKNQPLSMSVVSIGSLNSSIVHPREVYKIAILSNASSIILFNNHPSGDTTPSNEDISITTRLKECGKLIGVELIDHIIISDEGKYCSLKEKGIL
ncbi:DNA repair protein RadC [Clostridium estertheticum]|uniref:DNA repair protein RadC n=2 Tax=Clostridium estertheticum TaxID=238834 RepID=A0A1J0GMN7_9CLOT|nr:JAB domain-containing protein [Clostridium estertheticum]APC42535.1 DNA repair protein RadC [Clostridium estertheticum subsp. estertheticum]MBZ9615169.1 DNA repair protein RadC [Clostridium estertheticum subsp. laramiense]WAG75984.1 DNA repair protein RadC [Clostridium estertheticum]